MEFQGIDEFLEHREKRVLYQQELLRNSEGNVLATVRINYPGIEKSNYITDSMVNIIYQDIKRSQKQYIIYEEIYKNREGLIGHFIFKEDPLKIKAKLVHIEENHIFGRCMDIDVYYLKKNEEDMDEVKGLSRSDLDIDPRKCFICDEYAKICSRGQKHNIEEIKKYFQTKFDQYVEYTTKKDEIAYKLSQMSLKAIILEVSTMPSFGLVSPITMGSHKDMNYYTFIESSFAIVPYLKEMIAVGYSYDSSENIFNSIRTIGIEAEKAMFNATNGVNTHKGMIFLIGIVGAAIGKALYDEKSFDEVKLIIKDMCKDILKDFEQVEGKKKLTHGEKLYVEYGFTGIRGEVKNGLTSIFENVLPKFLESSLKENDLYAQTLLELMAIVDDSTIVHRQDVNALENVKKVSGEILAKGGFFTEEGKKYAWTFENSCIENNISPGGAADLLAVVIFLGNAKKLFKTI